MYYIIINNNKKEMQTLRPRPRSTEPDSAFYKDLGWFACTVQFVQLWVRLVYGHADGSSVTPAWWQRAGQALPSLPPEVSINDYII